MAISIRMIGLAAAAALLATAAEAEAVKGAGFTASFPCQTKQASQNVVAGAATIPIVSYSCEGAGSLYYVVASTYPKGFIAKKTLAAAYKDAVGGAASNVKGKVRTDQPIKLGAVAGRDVLIDIPSDKAAAHLRVFFVGDKQFQVMVVGAKGRETAKPAMDFLGSFKLAK
jgi:hypothetical protein